MPTFLPPTTTTMSSIKVELPSPSPSHAGDKSDEEAPMDLGAEYLNPESFLGLDSGPFMQQPNSTVDPLGSYGEMPFGSLEGLGLDYDFTFGNDFLGLPSPPNTNTSFDPPSPSNGFMSSASSNMDIPTSLDPALTSTIQSANFNDHTSPEPQSATAGTKRNQKGDGTRTKTSHTTIERRYRDNLNSGMMGLRQAVPALRILDRNISPPPGVVDVIDERGYVDGVRAAKKNSKSTILGKATEYIMVLKRRENRLRTELHALKIFVIENVPDSVNTLAEWEANHQAQFGGEQSDELPPQDAIEDYDDDEEDGARPAKKPKVKAAEPAKKEVKKVSAPPPIGPNGEPLKQKRGRPRKVPVNATGSEVPLSLGESQFLVLPQNPTATEAQPVRYLLTAFAFFSFLGNLPSSTTPFTSSHQGTVLNQLPLKIPISPDWWDGGLVQAAQLITSLLLLLSLLAPHLPASIQSLKFMRLFSVSTSASPKNPETRKEGKHTDGSLEATGTKLADFSGLVSEFGRYHFGKPNSKAKVAGWRKSARDILLRGDDISWVRRLRIYYAIASAPEASLERILIGYPIFPVTGARQWEELRKTDNNLKKLALSNNIQDSLRILGNAREDGATPNTEVVQVLARGYLASALNDQARHLFAEKVLGPCREDSEGNDDDLVSTEQVLKHSAKTLGPDFELLLGAFCDLTSPTPTCPDIMTMEFSGNLASARDAIRASQLFVQLFPNRPPTSKADHTPLSPPPSPSNIRNRHTVNRQHELRCLLGRDVFENPAVDQARDVVVDLLTRSQ